MPKKPPTYVEKLSDTLAMKAMESILFNRDDQIRVISPEDFAKEVAQQAYLVADAMMAERKKRHAP